MPGVNPTLDRLQAVTTLVAGWNDKIDRTATVWSAADAPDSAPGTDDD
ncbi:hypothetical protein [Natrinema pallidum]|nr:hypothetical protein [Natrinema pallidum]